jgi:hemerythrin superfamily protein
MSEWKLKKITLEFKQGYSFNKTEDRYEGKIEFENDEFESFSVKVTDKMSEPYLKLIAAEVVKNAHQLADKLEKSLIKQQEQ